MCSKSVLQQVHRWKGYSSVRLGQTLDWVGGMLRMEWWWILSVMVAQVSHAWARGAQHAPLDLFIFQPANTDVRMTSRDQYRTSRQIKCLLHTVLFVLAVQHTVDRIWNVKKLLWG